MLIGTKRNRNFQLHRISLAIMLILVVIGFSTLTQSAHATPGLQPTQAATQAPTPAASAIATLDQTNPTQLPVENLVVHVLAVYPHDTTAYTEGLEMHGKNLLESTGTNGVSTLREVEPQTGKILREVSLDKNLYGEGLSVNGDKIIQLTWTSGIALIYDLATFKQLGTFSFDGEGWGLCLDGQQFYMSNGSANLTIRDPNTFATLDTIPVTLNGIPVKLLNELECVGNVIYANVWHTNNIVRIDKATGQVTALIDASGLLTPQETAMTGPEGVLNGIAYDPDAKNFFITGKYWPWLYRVEFVKATANG